MIRITISAEAYAAIAASLPWGTVGVERERAQNGHIYIWLDPRVVNKLKALRGPGESYSDVILALARPDQTKRARTERHVPLLTLEGRLWFTRPESARGRTIGRGSYSKPRLRLPTRTGCGIQPRPQRADAPTSVRPSP